MEKDWGWGCQPVCGVSSGDSGSFGPVTGHCCFTSTALTTCQCFCSTWRALGHYYHLAIRLFWCHRQATEHTQIPTHARTDAYTLIIQTVCAWGATGEGGDMDMSLAAVTVRPNLPPALWWQLAWFLLAALLHSLSQHSVTHTCSTHIEQYPPAVLIVSLDYPYESFLPYSKTNTDNLMWPFLSSYGSK